MCYQTCAFDHEKVCSYDCPMYTVDGCGVREISKEAVNMRASLSEIEHALSSIRQTLAYLVDGLRLTTEGE